MVPQGLTASVQRGFVLGPLVTKQLLAVSLQQQQQQQQHQAAQPLRMTTAVLRPAGAAAVHTELLA
jgi:hypothetical protein